MVFRTSKRQANIPEKGLGRSQSSIDGIFIVTDLA
jgi:hypothetical protein